MPKQIHQLQLGSKMTFLPEEQPAWQAAGCREERVGKAPAWLPLFKIVPLGMWCWLLSVVGYWSV